jgi:protein-S-isoprenylcysteine O-methyltransferase Ste14
MSLHDTMVKHGYTMFRYRSYLPLLIIPPILIAMKESIYVEQIVGDDLEDAWIMLCFLFSMFGLWVRAYTVGHVPGGTSGRNTQSQRAHHLNTTGMYSIVRNPLYLGNFIIILGVLLSIKVWWLVLLGSLVFFIYMERIILAEEKFLAETYGQPYLDWREKTPAIWPDFKLWQKPELPFSLKTVLKREYPGLIAIGAAYFITEFITDVFFEKEKLGEWLIDDIAWPIMLAVILAVGLTLRYLKKNTDFLKVEGR